MAGKKSVEDLAVFGGKPAFDSFIPVGKPNMGDKQEFISLVDKMWDGKSLTNGGPLVQEFEKKLAEYLGTKHALVVCNGTVALELAARALGFKGEVIVPSFTFIASAHCLKWQNITPVFCDVDPKTHTIDPKRVEELITPNTSGILGVHVWGQPCAIDELEEIAKRRNLSLLFDSAHAFGCSYKGKKIGNFGGCEVFSFHATKFFNSFEGGAIATNDDELAKKINMMRNFGFTGYDAVKYIGTNGKMIEIAAAMGIVNLKSLDEMIAMNKSNLEDYRTGLAGIPGVSLFPYNAPDCEYNYQYIVLEVQEESFGIDRDQLVCLLNAENLSARRYFYPGCHNMEPYKSEIPHSYLLLPETIALASRVICLPNGRAISKQQIQHACELIRFAHENASLLKRSLPRHFQPPIPVQQYIKN